MKEKAGREVLQNFHSIDAQRQVSPKSSYSAARVLPCGMWYKTTSTAEVTKGCTDCRESKEKSFFKREGGGKKKRRQRWAGGRLLLLWVIMLPVKKAPAPCPLAFSGCFFHRQSAVAHKRSPQSWKALEDGESPWWGCVHPRKGPAMPRPPMATALTETELCCLLAVSWIIDLHCVIDFESMRKINYI